ncbi:hypothetical protein [Agromyces sp. Leaf222]|uniref:hypothetical protein n=1 Tax=Agromyces sp. Leaf222 TaxID=1735688 RepID=UPI0007012F88|nr:hypothetical protein [Agromyces sp. Leaf222]KQM81531.1 hypothetical protein ASE68_17445 [Agromyces sp. Leaf222]
MSQAVTSQSTAARARRGRHVAAAHRPQQGRIGPETLRLLLGAAIALVLALSAWLGSVAGAGAAHAAEDEPSDTTVSWSVRPADTLQGTARPNFAYEALPGQSVADALLVTNRSTTSIDLEVYAADGFLTPDGSLDILPKDQESVELGSWVEIASPSITLASGQTMEIPFELTVPEDAPPGDYAAGVVASMSVDAAGVITERRLGSRVHLRVSGDLVPALTVTDVSVAYTGTPVPFAPGDGSVTFTLTNTGNTRLAPDAVVQLSGPFGLAPVTVRGSDLPELLPGSTIEHTVQVAGVAPLGLVTADVAADADVVVRPGDTQTPPEVAGASASASGWAVPWTSMALVLLVAGLVTWWLLARRRAKAAKAKAIDEAVAAALAARDAADAVPASDAVPAASAAAEPPSGDGPDDEPGTGDEPARERVVTG